MMLGGFIRSGVKKGVEDAMDEALPLWRDKVVASTARAVLSAVGKPQIIKDIHHLRVLAKELKDNDWDEEHAESFIVNDIATRYATLLELLERLAQEEANV